MVKHTPVRTRTAVEEVDANRVEDQLGQLQQQFDLLKAQVRQAQQLSSLGTAAATIAHEVNNLLTPILGYAEYAVNTDDTELHKKALSRAATNIRILIGMSERLLRLGAAKTRNVERVDVGHVVRESIDSLCRDLGKDSISVTVDVPDSLAASADALQLQQVLFNLLLNAREAMLKHHGGRLKISAGTRGDCVVIEVHNTGDAIPQDVLPTIFDAFSSSKPVKRDGKERCGGLGLALCRDLMEENEGSISVTSTAESGTTFRLTLPVATTAVSA